MLWLTWFDVGRFLAMATDFSLRVEQSANGAVVLLAGDLDLDTAPQLRACLLDFTGQNVVLDFSKVTLIDLTVIGVLVVADLTEHSGGSLTLHGVQAAQRKVFNVVGVSEAFAFDDENGS